MHTHREEGVVSFGKTEDETDLRNRYIAETQTDKRQTYLNNRLFFYYIKFFEKVQEDLLAQKCVRRNEQYNR
jgi:hypothetical protein